MLGVNYAGRKGSPPVGLYSLVFMAACPQCSSPLPPQAVQCPRCKIELKAHGHPGIDLHRATGAEPLCATCLYDADDSCTYPKRPKAMDCTLYRSVDEQPELKPNEIYQIPWQRKHATRIALFILIVFSLIILSL